MSEFDNGEGLSTGARASCPRNRAQKTVCTTIAGKMPALPGAVATLEDANAKLKVKLGAVILAGGESSRLGVPKQLLVWQGRPLVVRAAEAALNAGVRNVVVVAGANAERVRKVLRAATIPVRVVENTAWREGMASSVRVGVEALAEADAVLVALCDQPFFTAGAAMRLIETWGHGGGIAAARYAGHTGVPAVFSSEFFNALKSLTGDTGARRIILENRERVTEVDLPELAFDVDTPENWARLQRGVTP